MRRAVVLFTVAAVAVTTIGACAGAARTPPGEPEPTTGVQPTSPPTITPAEASAEPPPLQQATAGMQAYDKHCARCHGAELVDGFAAQLSKLVLARYGTAEGLFEYVRSAMPKGNPASLSDQEYYDLTAYLLFKQGLLQSDQIVNADTARGIALSEQ